MCYFENVKYGQFYTHIRKATFPQIGKEINLQVYELLGVLVGFFSFLKNGSKVKLVVSIVHQHQHSPPCGGPASSSDVNRNSHTKPCVNKHPNGFALNYHFTMR